MLVRPRPPFAYYFASALFWLPRLQHFDLSLYSRVGLTPRISGAAHSTQETIRNWLRGLRCMRLLDTQQISRAVRSTAPLASPQGIAPLPGSHSAPRAGLGAAGNH